MKPFHDKVTFIWSVADLLRGDYKASEYGRVILPLTVLRRLDCVLEPTKAAVLEAAADPAIQAIANIDPVLCRVAGQRFYNRSPLDFRTLLSDPPHIADNLRAYINGFSTSARETFEKFTFDDHIDRMDTGGILFLVIQKFAGIDLHPDAVPNSEMGTIFEELIRRFSEQSNETAGEHFTPREVVRLMVDLLFIEDDPLLRERAIIRTLYDLACGTGGMLSVAQERLAELNPEATLAVYGQEINPESYAICRWIIENDWLEAIIGLPDQLFYNTGISTYIWILTNRKRPERRGAIQLVNASGLFTKMRKSLGNKRNLIAPEQIDEIVRLYGDFGDVPDEKRVKIFRNEDFGFRQITVERPLRLRYQVTEEGIARALAARAIQAELAGDDGTRRDALLAVLHEAAAESPPDEKTATLAIEAALHRAQLKLSLAARKALLEALATRDESAPPVIRNGKPVPDPELRDTENVPLTEDVTAYMAREVLPYVPDAWIDESRTKIGYEIPFTRHFYEYTPPRPLEEIDAEIKALEAEILDLLREVVG